MNYNSPGHRPNAYNTQATHRQKRASSITGALICAILFLSVILIALVVISARNKASAPDIPQDPYVTDSTLASDSLPSVTPPVDTIMTEAYDPAFIGPPAPITEPDSVIVTVNNSEIHEGNLILVNRNYPFVFPEEQPQTDLFTSKDRTYQLSTISLTLNTSLVPIFNQMLLDFSEATGCRKVLVTSGYRSYQTQKDLYESRVKSQGEEKASLYVALPGNSEHHAGLAIDMVIFTDGRQYYFPEYEDAAWIIENAPEYGFFLRYTEKAQEITGCASEPWHYRYVGTPHARLITDMDRCFEEYHDYLHTFVWEGERLLVAEDGSTKTTDGFHLPNEGYMIYYVPAMEGASTDIPVPPDREYEISGDNANGFIVTVKLGA